MTVNQKNVQGFLFSGFRTENQILDFTMCGEMFAIGPIPKYLRDKEPCGE